MTADHSKLISHGMENNVSWSNMCISTVTHTRRRSWVIASSLNPRDPRNARIHHVNITQRGKLKTCEHGEVNNGMKWIPNFMQIPYRFYVVIRCMFTRIAGKERIFG
jgi:hypothetical protein